MKTNVEYISKDFYVNPDKKIVVCKLIFDIDLSKIAIYRDLISDDIHFYDRLLRYASDNINSFDMEIIQTENEETLNEILRVTVVRKAKCVGADEFNEEFGKRLAMSKTQAVAFEVATNVYDILYNYIEDIYMQPIENLSDGSYDAFQKCYNHVHELISETK